MELGDRLRRFLHAALLDAGAHHQLQRGGAFRPVLRRQPAEMPLGEIGAALEIAAIEHDARAAERGERMRSAALEQFHRFVELSLAPA